MAEPTNTNPVMRRYADYLKAHHLRRTPERDAILTTALGISKHFTIDQLQQILDIDSCRVSTATVYNTVDLLVEAGVLRRLVFDGLPVQYERMGTTPHTHLICTSCGKIKEVRDKNFTAMINTQRFSAFNVSYYSLAAYGTCSACARRLKREENRHSTRK